MFLSLVRLRAWFSVCIASNCVWIILLHPAGLASFVVHMCIWECFGSRSLAIVRGLARSISFFCSQCFCRRRMLFVCNAMVLRLHLVAREMRRLALSPQVLPRMRRPLQQLVLLLSLSRSCCLCGWYVVFLRRPSTLKCDHRPENSLAG